MKPRLLLRLPPALELLSELVGYEEVQQSILFGLVGLLKAADSGSNPAAVTGTYMTSLVPRPPQTYIAALYFHNLTLLGPLKTA